MTCQCIKIAELDIAKHSSAVFIDGIDGPVRKRKRVLFEETMVSRHYLASDVVIVDDYPESELAAGKSRGLSSSARCLPRTPFTPALSSRIACCASSSTTARPPDPPTGESGLSSRVPVAYSLKDPGPEQQLQTLRPSVAPIGMKRWPGWGSGESEGSTFGAPSSTRTLAVFRVL
jgi:hypothetical protein